MMRTIVPMVCERLRLRFPGRPERPVQRATVLVPNRSGLAIASHHHRPSADHSGKTQDAVRDQPAYAA
jgi:hypothetical protein